MYNPVSPQKIATWNVNSIKVRLPQILQWLAEHQPDILALQETKTIDENFPRAEIEAAGYHVVCSGQKAYNGVALLSRMQPCYDPITDIADFADPQRRILAATWGDTRIINLYVPNGQSVDSEKYQYKLNWLDKVTGFINQQVNQYANTVVLGDFNIAPEDRDVYDATVWQDKVLCSGPERQAFQRLLNVGFKDAFRLFHQDSEHYSWWDYRAGSFHRNLGLRIDHILVSESLSKHCKGSIIDKIPRKNSQPSDHTPVLIFF